MELLHPIFKWLHIIAGITWIGLLYFFNFINGHVAATMDGETKKKVVPELMPRTLYWFRWGAAWTWVTGIILLYVIFWAGSLSMGESAGNTMFAAETEVTMWAHIMLLVTFVAVFIYDFLYKKVKFGNNVMIGGQAGISGHLNIGNNVQIGGGSGVIKNIPDNTKVMGYPATEIKNFLKEMKSKND